MDQYEYNQQIDEANLHAERKSSLSSINNLNIQQNLEVQNEQMNINQIERIEQIQDLDIMQRNIHPIDVQPDYSKEQQMKASCIQQFFFFMKSIFWSIFKIRNIKTLFYRISTVLIVVYYYYVVEKITYENRVQNEYFLLAFILTWHFVSMNFKIFQENKLKKNEKYQTIIILMGIILTVGTILFLIVWAIMAAFKVQVTQMDTNYWGTRYTYMFFYILLNILICALPLFNNFMFFISDGIILSQLTSMYLVNELSMTCLLAVLPFLFVVQNHMLVRGIKNYKRDQENKKLSFVRMVGRHDATFLFVIYSLFTFLFNMIDFFSHSYYFGINFWYLIYAYCSFESLMESKTISTCFKWVSFISVLIYTATYCYSLTFLENPNPSRLFPLYDPSRNYTESVNSTSGNSTSGGLEL